MSESVFLTHLQEHFKSVPGTGYFREKSWQKFLELGLPSKVVESFRYVHLRELYLSLFQGFSRGVLDKSQFCDAILPECAHSHIVFVDGVYSPHLSDLSSLPPQMVLLSLEEAFNSHGSFLHGHLTRFLKEETDPFACLNLSLNQQGAFLYLPPKLESVAPLQCLHVVTGVQPQLLAPHLHLVLGAQSKLRCVVTAKELQAKVSHFHLPMIQISVEEGASLDLLTVIEGVSWHMQTLRATLKRDARLNSLSMTLGGKAARQSYRVSLKGENSEAHLNGLWMLHENCTAHTHATIEHQAPHTRSMQRFKGVLNGISQSSFEGKILVEKQAQKTEAYQLNNNLILSPGAIAYSKPNLEVFADDVKASHGATVSQLDEQQLFYLRARGISPGEARRLLIEGFCREMIDAIPYASLHHRCRAHLPSGVICE